MPTKKSTKTVKEVMTIEKLQTELIKTNADLTDAKRGLRLGELANPRAITVMRKKIARIQTAIRADQIANLLSSKKGDK